MSEVFVGMSSSYDVRAHATVSSETHPEIKLMTAAPDAQLAEKVEPFKFTGEAGEYFRIWVAEEARESRCG